MQRLVQRNPTATRDRLDRDDQFGVEGNAVAVEILPHRHGHRAAFVEDAVDDFDAVDRLLARLDDVVDEPADSLGVAEVGADRAGQRSEVGLVVAIEFLELALVGNAVRLAVLADAEGDVLGVVEAVQIAVLKAGDGGRRRHAERCTEREDRGEGTTQAGERSQHVGAFRVKGLGSEQEAEAWLEGSQPRVGPTGTEERTPRIARVELISRIPSAVLRADSEPDRACRGSGRPRWFLPTPPAGCA